MTLDVDVYNKKTVGVGGDDKWNSYKLSHFALLGISVLCSTRNIVLGTGWGFSIWFRLLYFFPNNCRLCSSLLTEVWLEVE